MNLKLLILKLSLIPISFLYSLPIHATHGGDHDGPVIIGGAPDEPVPEPDTSGLSDSQVTEIIDAVDLLAVTTGIAAVTSSLVLLIVVFKGANYLLDNVRGN